MCARCWKQFVDTYDYGSVCTYGRFERPRKVFYKVSIGYVRASAKLGCSWCTLVETSMYHRNWTLDKESEVELTVGLASEQSFMYSLTVNDRIAITSFTLMIDKGYRDIDKIRLELLAYTPAEDISAFFVPVRPVRTDVRVEKIENDIRNWLERCSVDNCCKPTIDTALPTRLVQISPSGDHHHVRLIETDGRKGRYATLSYCWGAPSNSVLTSANLLQYQDQIPWEEIPQTIKDAILVARTANILYLWVDALCILQDSELDKRHEIANMSDIYRKSILTIVAASASDSSKGFLEPRVYPGHTFNIPFRIARNEYGTVSLLYAQEYWASVREDPIQKRAWTFQEQLLAQRILYFGSRTLAWRCAAGSIELEPSSCHFGSFPEYRSEYELLFSSSGSSPQDLSKVLGIWMRLVANFNPRETTFENDRLQALAAVAQLFSKHLGPAYYAGLWQFDIDCQLDWFRPKPASRKGYSAPTWSWASSTGECDIGLRNLNPLLKVLSVECTPLSEEIPYGAVKSGYISVSSRHIRAQLVRFPLDRVHRGHTIRSTLEKDQWTIIASASSERECVKNDAGEREKTQESQGYDYDSAHWSIYFDNTEEMEPRAVVCLELHGTQDEVSRGLVLEAVPSERGTFKRIGYFVKELSRDKDHGWTSIELRII